MSKMKIRVPADKAEKVKKEYDEMGMGSMCEIIPTDLYGARTMYPKGTDLQEVIKDVHEIYGH